jgi:hypothetical protein
VLTSLVTTALAEAGGIDVASSSKVAACLRQAGQTTGAPFDPALAPDAARTAEVDQMLVPCASWASAWPPARSS